MCLKMQTEYAYLAEGPEGLLRTCDVVLKLADGTGLPAHTHVLARYSTVFNDMLDNGPLSCASGMKKADVPFTECSEVEAISFLTILYSASPQQHISGASALSTANIPHKYGMKILSLLTFLRACRIAQCKGMQTWKRSFAPYRATCC